MCTFAHAHARAMRWSSLPPELLVHVFAHLTLPRLRLLKAVSRATAQTCRSVLRSAEWCKGTNRFEVEEELKTQSHSYKLPMTVSMFHRDFKDGHKCIATVHRLKLLRLLEDAGDYLNTRDRKEWEYERLNDDSTFTVVGEMCIEIHGEGVVGSEYALRNVLQEVMRQRGRTKFSRGLKADELNGSYEDVDEDGEVCVTRGGTEMSLHDLLRNICPVTEIAHGVWEVHQEPCSMQGEYEHMSLNVLDMCKMGLGLFL